MTPDNEKKGKVPDITLPKERVTINIDKIDLEIVNNLVGVIGNSKSSVIYQMVKDWINENTEKIMNVWDIDLAGIRRQVLAEVKGVKIEKEMEDLERKLLKELPAVLKSIESIELTELAKDLKVNQRTIKNLIYYHSDELEKAGLEIIYKDGRLINKSLS